MSTAGDKTILLVAAGYWREGLIYSYERAFQSLGWRVERFHLEAERLTSLSTPRVLDPIFTRLLGHLDLPAPTMKANRALVMAAMKLKPSIVLVTSNEAVRPSTLVHLKVVLPETRLVNIFPDTLFNMRDSLVNCLPLYDAFCVHTRAGIPWLERLGCRAPLFVPLAADPTLHHPMDLTEADRREYGCDLVYVGNYRPEHEALFARLEGMDLAIWGSNRWLEATKGGWVRSRWRGRPLVTSEGYTKAHLAAKVCLNPIDPLNFPAHNQRVFELPACGVFSLVTRTQDTEEIFRDGETIALFGSPDEMVEKVRHYLARPDERERIARAAYAHVVEGGHTYRDRVRMILEKLGLDA